MIIDGGKLRVVWPSQAIDRTTPIGAMEKRIQQYFVDTSPKQLRSHFDIDARSRERSSRCVVSDDEAQAQADSRRALTT